MDIGILAIASAVLHLALGAVMLVTIEMGFLVESQPEEELPWRLFVTVHITQMEMDATEYVKLPPDEAMPETAHRARAGFRVSSVKVVNYSR
jgi:cytochrome b561